MSDISLIELKDGLLSLLASGKYSDLTIQCGEVGVAVHRAVLCPRSKFFAKACDGPFEEASSGKVNLEGDDPYTIERMLSYLYTLDYSDNSAVRPLLPTGQNWPLLLSNEESKSVLELDAQVYAIAEKYDISGLKDLAKHKYKLALGNCSGGDFLRSIQQVYQLTPPSDRGLRDLVIEYTSAHMTELRAKNEFTVAIEDIPGFCVDLLQAVLNAQAAPSQKRHCKFCRTERIFHWSCSSCENS